MRINSLSLENYRNIILCDLTPGEGVNLIVGDNAQGKTNLMEAIWLLTGEKTDLHGTVELPGYGVKIYKMG